MHQIKCVLKRYPSLMYYSFIKLDFYGILIHNTFFPSISYCHLYAYLNVCFDAINQCSNSIPRIFIYIEIDICTIWIPIQHILNNDWCFRYTKSIIRWNIPLFLILVLIILIHLERFYLFIRFALYIIIRPFKIASKRVSILSSFATTKSQHLNLFSSL